MPPSKRFTVPAVTVNVAEVEPAGTVTLAGTLAAVPLELESVTNHSAGSGCCRQTNCSSARIWPLTIVLGLTETLLRAPDAAGLTVTPKVLLTPE